VTVFVYGLTLGPVSKALGLSEPAADAKAPPPPG
jgi:hypothetical protein